MSHIVIIQFVFSAIAAALGGMAGWWLRGRPMRRTGTHQAPVRERKQFAEDALKSLHAAAETVRTCVQQHIDCIQAIQSELRESSATEPAIISNAASSIIAANGLVRHQFADIQRLLDNKQEEINEKLADSNGLLLTFASLDRQKHVYAQVLASLEQLAAQLVGDVAGHEKRLQGITERLTKTPETSLDGVNEAVGQILNATNEIQNRVATTEKRIEQQAENVRMQAILTHTDLLTSLPNRRALETELERVSTQSRGRGALCTAIMLDLDGFQQVNTQYGHQGGDVILRQVASIIKDLARGKDLVTRFGGDTFALLLGQTTLHDALPVAERVRKQIESAKFSHGNRPLKVTASLGIAQLRSDEVGAGVMARAEEALHAAKQAGGNLCFRHDGQQCHAVSSAFHAKEQQAAETALSLASLWRDAQVDEALKETSNSLPATAENPADPVLTGRSLFANNLSRRLAEWKRGGPAVSVVVLRVDQMSELVERFGAGAQTFLRQVLGRLLEAATRDMDERCEFEDGIFALLLPGIDEPDALAVADRLRSQVRQCKVRMGDNLWDLTASIGLAHSSVACRVMDIMRSAEAAMNSASNQGGDTLCLGEPIKEEQPVVIG